MCAHSHGSQLVTSGFCTVGPYSFITIRLYHISAAIASKKSPGRAPQECSSGAFRLRQTISGAEDTSSSALSLFTPPANLKIPLCVSKLDIHRRAVLDNKLGQAVVGPVVRPIIGIPEPGPRIGGIKIRPNDITIKPLFEVNVTIFRPAHFHLILGDIGLICRAEQILRGDPECRKVSIFLLLREADELLEAQVPVFDATLFF